MEWKLDGRIGLACLSLQQMDITEQLNWLGDADKPFEAAKELARLRVYLLNLRIGLLVSLFTNLVLLVLLAFLKN